MTLIKRLVLPATAMFCIHSAALATQPQATGSAHAAVRVATSGAMSIGSNGSALSVASSSQSAYAKTTPSMAQPACPPGTQGVSASVAGETATRSSGVAYNTSTGSGTGSASAAGSAGAAAQGSAGIQGLHTGNSGGSTGTYNTFNIQAVRNQGSGVQGSTASGFQTVLNFDRSSGPTVQASTTGYVTGANASGALAGMNAAGVTSIQASGYFNGTGQASTAAAPHP